LVPVGLTVEVADSVLVVVGESVAVADGVSVRVGNSATVGNCVAVAFEEAVGNALCGSWVGVMADIFACVVASKPSHALTSGTTRAAARQAKLAITTPMRVRISERDQSLPALDAIV
jgi:hypothetical protein